jgi:N-acylneuraminate cytidylyltransferase
MIAAIIPARGGSKGIPRKNVRRIHGVPLLTYTVRHALESDLVTQVIVSTDDDEIAEVATGSGAAVIRRPPELAGDFEPSESALLHALDELEFSSGHEPELLVFLQATSPIRMPGQIDGAIRLLFERGFDSVFSSSPDHGFVWELAEDGRPSPLTYNPAQRPMRQQIGERVVENGSIYVMKPHILRTTGCRLGGRIGVYRMGYLEGFQVDEARDLQTVETILDLLDGPNSHRGFAQP